MQDLPSDTQVIKTDCALCVNCCGINAYVSKGRFIKVEGMKEHPVNRGGLCPKGEKLVDYAYAAIGDGIKVYLRKSSPNILWDKVRIQE